MALGRPSRSNRRKYPPIVCSSSGRISTGTSERDHGSVLGVLLVEFDTSGAGRSREIAWSCAVDAVDESVVKDTPLAFDKIASSSPSKFLPHKSKPRGMPLLLEGSTGAAATSIVPSGRFMAPVRIWGVGWFLTKPERCTI